MPVTVTVTVKVNIVLMMTGWMGLEPILPVKVPITMGTMLNFDGDCHGDGHGIGMCKQTLIRPIAMVCTILLSISCGMTNSFTAS